MRYFFVNLLCVFIPVFMIDGWKMRKEKSLHSAYLSKPVLVMATFASSVICTLFNFSISSGLNVNLSIVSLTMAFFLLPWAMALLVLALYILFQIGLSTFLLAHGTLTSQVVHTVLTALPKALIVIYIYAFIMCACSIVLRNQRFLYRGIGFIFGLLCYTAIDYVYVRHVHHFPHFSVERFLGFILLFNLTFFLAVRLLVTGQSASKERIDEIRMEKLEIISQLSASVAHEIRNPITVVRGFTQLMMTTEFNGVKPVEFLKHMLQELDRAEAVISDFLQLAKKPTESIERDVHLTQLIDQVINLLTPYAKNKNIEIKSTVEEGIYVYGNPVHVTQAMMNLVKNAIEANDQAGTVVVSLRKVGNVVQLKVLDTGRGMTQPTLSRLGEPYYSTKTQGTGLGLTLVYKVINDLNGKIQVQSRVGVGTTFTIALPNYEHVKAPETLTQSHSLANLDIQEQGMFDGTLG